MALTAAVDVTKTPNELKVTSDRRKIAVTAAGESTTSYWPVVIVDASGKVWTLKTDDGSVAVYTG
jgi:hypothetical protein